MVFGMYVIRQTLIIYVRSPTIISKGFLTKSLTWSSDKAKPACDGAGPTTGLMVRSHPGRVVDERLEQGVVVALDIAAVGIVIYLLEQDIACGFIRVGSRYNIRHR